jgi:PEP-CTERM motif
MSIKSLSIVAAAAMSLFAGAAQAVTNGLANGGFEIVGTTTPALNWGSADLGYALSSDARTGSSAMLLMTPAFNASQGFQNSVEDGGLGSLVAGDTPLLSFWAKGSTIFTGNSQFFLQYLDSVGNILFNSNSVQFQSQINSSTWSEITYQGPAVPVGATAALVRFVSATGPVIPEFDGSATANMVLIDDVVLGVVPEPGTYALMLAGLVGVGAIVRRRRAV